MNMAEVLGPIDHGDPYIDWNEANAASDDGQAVIQSEREAGEAELEARIAALVKEWPREIRAAQDAVIRARSVLDKLHDCDVEIFDTAAGGEAGGDLATALMRLNRVATIAAGRLKLVEDAEVRAELEELRAENARLRASLQPGSVV